VNPLIATTGALIPVLGMERTSKKNFIVSCDCFDLRRIGEKFGDCNLLIWNVSCVHRITFFSTMEGAYAQRIPSDSSVDGAKWVCDPHRIAKKKDCLVYSVGSFGNTVFERGVKSEIGEHCEVHTFDVEPSNARNGDFKSKVEAAGASFHL